MQTSYFMTILGQSKSGKNALQITRTGHRYPTKSFVIWRDDAVRQVKAQWATQRITEPCLISIKYYPGDLRRRDVPGIIDAIFHVLEKANIVSDDTFFTDVLFMTLPLNRNDARVELEIKI